MASYRNIWSFARYHLMMQPSLYLAKKAGRKLIYGGKRAIVKRWPHARNLVGKIPPSDYELQRKANIRKFTRGSTAANARLWSKESEAGVKRRKRAAKKAWKNRTAYTKTKKPINTNWYGKPKQHKTRILHASVVDPSAKAKAKAARAARRWKKEVKAARKFEKKRAYRAAARYQAREEMGIPHTRPSRAKAARPKPTARAKPTATSKPTATPKPTAVPTPPTPKVAKKVQKPVPGGSIYKRHNAAANVGTVEGAVSSSKTHGQLRLKLGRMAARSISRDILPAGADRDQRAKALKKLRKSTFGAGTKSRMKARKIAYAAKAAEVIQTRGQQKT